ncbi:MAG TPA: hypothetical protein PKI49_16445 [Pseudomonadota bacterium]|nr:hypothetical protein [Pseudomonadota bacterium]
MGWAEKPGSKVAVAVAVGRPVPIVLIPTLVPDALLAYSCAPEMWSQRMLFVRICVGLAVLPNVAATMPPAPAAQRLFPSVLCALRTDAAEKKSAAVLVSMVPFVSMRAMTRLVVADAVLATAAVPTVES